MKRKFVWLALLTGMAPIAPISAQGVVPCVHEARFGLVGLARLQIARLSVANLVPPDPVAPPAPVHPPDPITPPDPCRVAIGFLKTSNQLFENAAGEPIVLALELRPGQSAFIELGSTDAFRGSRELRVPFRATGLFSHRTVEQPPDPCRDIIPSLEIYDAVTGRSQVVENPLEIFGFNPQPEPPGIPLALLRQPTTFRPNEAKKVQ
jgi:hypothetical protein